MTVMQKLILMVAFILLQGLMRGMENQTLIINMPGDQRMKESSGKMTFKHLLPLLEFKLLYNTLRTLHCQHTLCVCVCE